MRTPSITRALRTLDIVRIVGLAAMYVAVQARAAEAARLAQVPAGDIVRLDRFSSQYVAPHDVDVWLPPGYPRRAPYAVLYMLDGQNVFGAGNTWNHQSWQAAATASRLMAWGRTRPFIIVAIWNSPLRMSEYYPQKPWESLTAAQRRQQLTRRIGAQQVLPVAPFSDAYLRFVTRELVPAINRRFAVDSSRDATFIMGSSMGALMAWYAMARYPDVFGGAACLSTHWLGAALSLEPGQDDPAPDAFVRYIRGHFPSPAHHRIYFDHGTRTLDAWYGPTQLRVDRILSAKGWVGSHFESMVFPGADHSERSWAARLVMPMTFLLAPAGARRH
jgi:predicted alpha/beta superfamily hydrolase